MSNAYYTSTGINRNKPLKSTSPFPSVSNISMTRCTSGFCCNSGRDINSSTLREPELSRSSFLNRFPSLLISSASTEIERETKKRVRTSHLKHNTNYASLSFSLSSAATLHPSSKLQSNMPSKIAQVLKHSHTHTRGCNIAHPGLSHALLLIFGCPE